MSNQADPNRIEALLIEGIQEARSKRKDVARELLQEVVQLDPQNEKGWFWLASVVDTDEERITCLQNVVLINPDNTRAFQILERLEQRAKAQQASAEASGPASGAFGLEDSAPAGEAAAPTTDDPLAGLRDSIREPFTIFGLDPQRSRYAVIGGVAMILSCCLLAILIITGGGGDDGTSDNNGDESAANNNPTATSAPTQSADQIATLTAAAPTPLPTLPPTRTPAPTATATPELEQLPAPPPDALGQVVMRSGSLSDDRENQPIVLLSPSTGERRTISPENIRGNSASIAPDGLQFVYSQYDPTLRRHEPYIVNINGTNPQRLEDLFTFASSLNNLDEPVWSPNNLYIAFTADSTPGSEGIGRDVFIFFRDSLDNSEQNVRELDLTANGSAPAWSPDAARLVYVSDFSPSGQDAVELEVYEIGAESFTPITNDGNAIIEDDPNWSHDNTRIAFSGKREGASGSDIYDVPADGSGPSEMLFDFGSNDTNPVWSPDDRWIAFTSDRDGGLNVYIYDTQTEMFYAATTDSFSFDVVSDWIR